MLGPIMLLVLHFSLQLHYIGFRKGESMKKIFSLILLILSITIISGCVSDPNTYYFNYEELSSNVISIELINYENSNPRIINVNESSISNIDFQKMEVLEVLPSQDN